MFKTCKYYILCNCLLNMSTNNIQRSVKNKSTLPALFFPLYLLFNSMILGSWNLYLLLVSFPLIPFLHSRTEVKISTLLTLGSFIFFSHALTLLCHLSYKHPSLQVHLDTRAVLGNSHNHGCWRSGDIILFSCVLKLLGSVNFLSHSVFPDLLEPVPSSLHLLFTVEEESVSRFTANSFSSVLGFICF